MHEQSDAFVARLQEALRTCVITERAPDCGDDLVAVVEIVDEADQRRVDGRCELHRAASIAV